MAIKQMWLTNKVTGDEIQIAYHDEKVGWMSLWDSLLFAKVNAAFRKTRHVDEREVIQGWEIDYREVQCADKPH